MERPINAITPLKVAIVAISLIIIVTLIYVLFPKSSTLEEESESQLIHLTFDDTVQNYILFSDIKIFNQNEEFYVTANATNMTSNTLTVSPVTITLTDEDGEEIVLTSYIGETLEGEITRNITIKTNEDLKNIKILEINIETQVQS